MGAPLKRKPLGQLLLDKGVVKPEQLERALDEQKRSNHQKLLGEVLVEMRFCSEDQITESLAEAYGVPYARISPRIADPKVIPILPKEFLEKHQILPLFLVEKTLTVAVSEPANVFLLEEIERVSQYKVQLVAATSRDIRATLQTYLPNDKVFVIDDIIEEVKPEEFALIEQKIEDIANLEQAAGDSPVIKLVNYCIYNAVKEGASDIHIEPSESSLRIRYRIDGRLTEKLRPPSLMQAAVASRIKIMAGLDISERRLPQDGGIHVMMDKRPIDLRVSTMPGKHGEKVVIRIIDNDKASVNLERLGFNYETLKQWRKLISMPNGIVLVTGPTGSGKSTTLYAVLQELNADDVNICTIEDPVEYNLQGVNQFQVNEKAGFTFASALRSLLRQDPDIVMVGEVRDGETAKLATQAALTGHLVLSTLHTNDAPGAITRLFNLGIEPYLVGATVTGVLAQRLVRKLCQRCKEEYEPSINEKRQIERLAGDVEKLFRPKGCERCRNLGYTGRIGIYELFTPDDALVDKISNGANLNEIRTASRELGMRTLRADGLDKVKAGITTLEEVYRVTA
ncbi:MAG TPA: ATPase, T2SS/T4P/T4SS family [Tepidisphaeraceae bacterium]|jgi:type IV pilus assembly protein PilB|nr:ATPase, T2SS/T4P/T4SS family [Tepidisphaeraceae bacterium]